MQKAPILGKYVLELFLLLLLLLLLLEHYTVPLIFKLEILICIPIFYTTVFYLNLCVKI